MLDQPYKYEIKSTFSAKKKEKHTPDRVEKIITWHGKQKINIPVEHYGNVQFIKFYPHSLRKSRDKYKKRINYSTTPVRIFSTCIEIAVEKFKNNPELVIGVHGAWDQVDLKKGKNSSDRYELWLTCAASKFEKDKYIFVRAPSYNSFFVMKQEYFSEITLERLETLLIAHFYEIHEDFMLPSVVEAIT